jgi:hypothetical protein
METHAVPETSRTGAQKHQSHAPAVLFGLGILAAVLASTYLLRTNPTHGQWAQGYNPTGHWII